VPEPSPQRILKIKRSFTAFRNERGKATAVVFPVGIRVSIVQALSPVSDTDVFAYIAFSPLGNDLVYRMPELEFYERTDPVD
jgi:hypothetical protein